MPIRIKADILSYIYVNCDIDKPLSSISGDISVYDLKEKIRHRETKILFYGSTAIT